jgi:autotransporter translocation and assembly factor TamB
LAGTLGLTNSRFVKDVDLLPLRLPGRRSALPPTGSAGASARPEPPRVAVSAPPFDNWNLDVRLTTRDPFLIQSNLAQARAEIDLRVTGTGTAPVPAGRVTVPEARLNLPFSRITMNPGSITFDRATGFDGRLNFTGTSNVGGTEVSVQIYDRMFNPRFILTSNPPLPEEDIMTLLATGSTRSNLVSGDGAAAATKAALLALRRFRDRNRSSAEGGSSVAEFLEDRMTLELGQSHRKTGERNLGGTLRLWRQLFFQGTVDAEGDYRAGLKYRFEFE